MTREEKQKAINALKKSVPIMAMTQEEFNDYIHTLNKIIDWLEQDTVSKEVYDHEYFLRKEFELKIDKLQRQLEEQTVKAESILDKIRAEIAEYGSICVAYVITDKTKTDKGIEEVKKPVTSKPKMGKWENISNGIEYDWGTCNKCKARIPMAYKYYEFCPHCGTKMQEEEE